MIITPALLRERYACAPALGVFAREWPNGAEVTIENCLRATQLGLSLSWVADNLLSAPQLVKYVIQEVRIDADYWLKAGPINREYDRQIDPHYEAYQTATAPLWAEFQREQLLVQERVAYTNQAEHYANYVLLADTYHHRQRPFADLYNTQYCRLRDIRDHQMGPVHAEFNLRCATLFTALANQEQPPCQANISSSQS